MSLPVVKRGLGQLRRSPYLMSLLLTGLGVPASAVNFSIGSDIQAQADTTFSYGTGWLTHNPPDILTELPYSGLNRMDGHANFDPGVPFSKTYMVQENLSLNWHDKYGAQFSGLAFYDAAIMGGKPVGYDPYPAAAGCNPQVTPASQLSNCGFAQATREFDGRRIRGYDAYVWGNFNPVDRPLNVRLGYQVINWGEALYIQGGINSANPVSLAQLDVPGSEIKDALLPLPMAYFNLGVTDQISLEGFAEFGWHFSEAPGMGTFYSTNNAFGGYGAERVLVDMSTASTLVPGQVAAPGQMQTSQLLTQGQMNQLAQAYNYAKYGNASTVLTNQWNGDVSTSMHDQYGVALRIQPGSSGNEYALYAMNYSDHLPVVQFTLGPSNGAYVAGSAANNAVVNYLAGATGSQGLAGAVNQAVLGAVSKQGIASINGTNMGSVVGSAAYAGATGTGLVSQAQANTLATQATGLYGAMNGFNAIDNTTYNLVYPTNRHLFGASFSTQVSALSVAGELSYRPNKIILRELGDNLVAENAAWSPVLGNGGTANLQGSMASAYPNGVQAGQLIQDWTQVKEYTADLSAVLNLNNALHSDGMMAIFEVGGVHYSGYDASQHFASTKSLLDTMVPNAISTTFQPTTSGVACANGAAATTMHNASYCTVTEGTGGYRDYMSPWAWGYRVSLKATYDEVFTNINMVPLFLLGQDVHGNSDYTGSFMQGRKTAMMGVNTIYNQSLEMDLAYNIYWGGGPANLMADMDNLTLALKYTF